MTHETRIATKMKIDFNLTTSTNSEIYAQIAEYIYSFSPEDFQSFDEHGNFENNWRFLDFIHRILHLFSTNDDNKISNDLSELLADNGCNDHKNIFRYYADKLNSIANDEKNLYTDLAKKLHNFPYLLHYYVKVCYM